MSAVIQIGTDEHYTDKPSSNGTDDPFPTIPLSNQTIRNLVETRMAALSGRTLQVPPTWNDVVYAYRMVYGRSGNALGNFANLARNVPNLLSAYSAASRLAYTTADGTLTSTTDTDVTGKTLTGSTGQVVGGLRLQAAAAIATIPLAAGSTDNLVWLIALHGEPAVAATGIFNLRYTDATNFIRIFRASGTLFTVEKTVATVVTTERSVTVPAAEPLSGGAIALRINGTVAQFYMNGTLYDQWTLSAGAQGLTGLLYGFTNTVSRNALGEMEVWSTNYPGFAS